MSDNREGSVVISRMAEKRLQRGRQKKKRKRGKIREKRKIIRQETEQGKEHLVALMWPKFSHNELSCLSAMQSMVSYLYR